jgi:hypothetical protein
MSSFNDALTKRQLRSISSNNASSGFKKQQMRQSKAQIAFWTAFISSLLFAVAVFCVPEPKNERADETSVTDVELLRRHGGAAGKTVALVLVASLVLSCAKMWDRLCKYSIIEQISATVFQLIESLRGKVDLVIVTLMFRESFSAGIVLAIILNGGALVLELLSEYRSQQQHSADAAFAAVTYSPPPAPGSSDGVESTFRRSLLQGCEKKLDDSARDPAQ